MNVLSLFDGIACGFVALKKRGIKVDNYYASEVDKWAIQVAKKNHPKIIHLGDIKGYKSWNLPKIDLVIGGSPCQGFSLAGKQLNFDDPRSELFFIYVEILWMIQNKNPDVKFLLENVKMKKGYQDAITALLQVEPILINSDLVSAQNRQRLYWCNWEVKRPKDKGILLKDIVFPDCLFNSVFQFPHGCSVGGIRQFKKSPTLSKQFHNNYFPVCLHQNFSKNIGIHTKKSCALRAVASANYQTLLLSKKAINYMNKEVAGGRTHWDFKHHPDCKNDKPAAIVSNFFKGVPYNVLRQNGIIRKFDPIECERLQTLPDNYTKGVSNTQRYKIIGNGWTIDAIDHLLSTINEPVENIQLSF